MNALVILILVARGVANEPATQGAVRAARELLGPSVEVEVRELDEVPSDDRALAIGKALHATATIQLSWDAGEHRLARLHFRLEPGADWHDRVIGFERSDEPFERGRTIGYAVASMLPASTPKPTPTRPMVDAVDRAKTTAASSPLKERPRQHGSLDLVGSGALGMGGPAGGWGGSVSGRWYFAPAFALRGGASARSGQVELAQATSLLIHGAAGVAWLPISATAGRPFELGVRADLLAMREQLTHFSSDDPEPVVKSRWLPGADLALEGGWFFSPAAAVVGAICTEFAWGETNVTLHLQRVTTIPPVRLVMQAGVRATF